ncbi:MAG: ATP-binding cassette domain-containing protein, partial [Chthoniobacterales bacterium]|nr:ATP-binding cassette domain-containing protein [Chthoniobacterales bacterium]
MFNRTTSEPLQFSLQFLSKNGWKIISLDPPGANLHVHAPPVGPLLELSLEKEVSPTLVHFPELRLSPLNTKEKCNARIVFSGNKVLLKRADFDLNVYLRGVQLVESCKLNHGDVFHLEDFPVVFRALPSTAPPIMPPIFYNGRRVAVVPLLKKRLHVGSTNQCEILSLRSPIHGCLVRFARDRHRAPFVFNILPGSGALVNGQSFREHRLQPGDQVKVAGETFTFDGLNILIHSSFPQPLETRDIFLESNGVPILGPLNLQLYPGEFVGLFSPPAAGKTLLLRCLGGEITPSSGEVRIGSIPLSSILSKHPYLIGRASIRNLPEQAITVQEAFLFHLRIRQPSHLRLPQLIEQAEKISKELQIDHLLRRRIVELSATERRLVAIAIEIASKPIYLF